MIECIDDGLVQLTGVAGFHIGLWTRVKTRKLAFCVFSGRAIPKGAFAYRPLTNGYHRGQRVLADEMERRIRK